MTHLQRLLSENKILTMRTPKQAVRLAEFAKTLPRNSRMVEVGSYTGESAVVFAKYVNSLTCVDPWDGLEEIYKRFLARTGGLANIAHVRAFSVEAADRFEDGSLDVVYIDGAHDYDNVKADILAWRPKLRRGGVLAGHDYGPHAPGVVDAVDELIGKPSKVYGETTWRL